MMLKFLFCFLALIQTGWSANQYLFENNRYAAQGTQIKKPILTLEEHLRQIVIPKDYNVEYYFFSAPDDKLDKHEIEAFKKFAASQKKRQQVIFIKNPENTLYEKALRQLAQNTVQQQKTQIYVFNKEPNYASVQQKLQTIYKNSQNKPQVHFVKYHKPSDFESAQSAIIQKYGTTDSTSSSNSNKLRTRSVVIPKNEPVPKDYAKNFLPTGVDVVPGSSYIPLLVFY
ncbi:uncharacterized protein ACRADG_012863 [Cochliomyia hominivorax]